MDNTLEKTQADTSFSAVVSGLSFTAQAIRILSPTPLNLVCLIWYHFLSFSFKSTKRILFTFSVSTVLHRNWHPRDLFLLFPLSFLWPTSVSLLPSLAFQLYNCCKCHRVRPSGDTHDPHSLCSQHSHPATLLVATEDSLMLRGT